MNDSKYSVQIQMQVLNKYDKEQLVIKLHQEGKTMREIASAAHMSFGDIGRIIRKVDGRANNDNNIDLSDKSKETKALWLFENGRRPIDVAIELDIPYSRVEELQQEYWALKELYDVALVYLEIKNYLPSFMKLFNILKQHKMLSEKYILKFLRYADEDLATLENRCQQLSSGVLELQFRKKKLGDQVATQCSSISQLEKSLNWYRMEIKQKKQIISNLDQQLNQKSYALEEKLTKDNPAMTQVSK
jgi:hypothetical protein